MDWLHLSDFGRARARSIDVRVRANTCTHRAASEQAGGGRVWGDSMGDLGSFGPLDGGQLLLHPLHPLRRKGKLQTRHI